MEGINQIKTGNLVSLSEQELVDCNVQNYGCRGGYLVNAFEFIRQNQGLTTEDNYPYVGQGGTCKTVNSYQLAATITGYEEVPTNSEQALRQAVAYQPVAVTIGSDGDFNFYKSGVYSGTCGTRWDHTVTVVGYGTTDDGTKYWLVKNSWGSQWGENGYMKMKRDVAFTFRFHPSGGAHQLGPISKTLNSVAREKACETLRAQVCRHAPTLLDYKPSYKGVLKKKEKKKKDGEPSGVTKRKRANKPNQGASREKKGAPSDLEGPRQKHQRGVRLPKIGYTAEEWLTPLCSEDIFGPPIPGFNVPLQIHEPTVEEMSRRNISRPVIPTKTANPARGRSAPDQQQQQREKRQKLSEDTPPPNVSQSATSEASQLASSRLINEESSMLERHQQWMSRHGRVYKDEQEKGARFKIFKDNVDRINAFNSGADKGYKLGVNQFADLTNEEFWASRNGYKRQSPTSKVISGSELTAFRYANATVESSTVDWREKGAVTPVKYQGSNCGMHLDI
ncbi:hypothetical protein RHGRI_037699 [Rhododendron griersonianum]|uniref:Uncharacterized protein n=1 Tax=Rhododendron griersonianum TaxID=479676 RepID=A0AAV6HTP8_9ERIC|nr:hypothetical protein RHGRI_037699 [Rhododendron griersonianum]